MGDFALSGSVHLSPLEFGRRHGVTDQTARNWIRRGLPAEHDAADGSYRIDPAKGDAWVKTNVGEAPHGGKRRGAGRKKKRRRDGDGDEPGAMLLGGDREGVDAYDEEQVKKILKSVPLTDPEFVVKAMSMGISASQADRIVKLLRAGTEACEQAARRGELVEASVVAAQWSAHLRRVRQMVETIPLLAAERVARDLGLPASAVPRAEESVMAVVRGAMEAIGVADG